MVVLRYVCAFQQCLITVADCNAARNKPFGLCSVVNRTACDDVGFSNVSRQYLSRHEMNCAVRALCIRFCYLTALHVLGSLVTFLLESRTRG